MNRNSFFIAAIITGLYSCTANRVLQNESVLFPDTQTGKWWIMNAVAKDKQGKDVHYASLVSVDRSGGNNYATCFASLWYEADSSYYSGIRNSGHPKVKFKTAFPLKINFPANDSTAMESNWVLKRKSLLLQSELKKSRTANAGSIYTEMFGRFNEQKPFPLSKMNASPEIWAVAPLRGRTEISNKIQPAIAEKLMLRIFSDKDIFLARSTHEYLHWLDLTLNTGKQLAILFRTDTAAGIKTECILLWDEHDNLMPRPSVQLKMFKNERQVTSSPGKSYPLYFTVSLPGENISFLIKPRMVQQEIRANKNSFWMGAVEAVDERSNRILGKGNMYIFKQ